jgi:AcrR family transcriptional regulator
MPADERRAAIVAAALPLLAERGTAVTTRELAEAAGIAEGTIFRVFADKGELVAAALEVAFDPTPTVVALGAVPRQLRLEERLERAAEILLLRAAGLWRLMSAAGICLSPAQRERLLGRDRPPDLEALAALLEPDRDRLRLEPVAAARLLRGLVLAGNHPALVGGRPLPLGELVSFFLDGVRAR